MTFSLSLVFANFFDIAALSTALSLEPKGNGLFMYVVVSLSISKLDKALDIQEGLEMFQELATLQNTETASESLSSKNSFVICKQPTFPNNYHVTLPFPPSMGEKYGGRGENNSYSLPPHGGRN